MDAFTVTSPRPIVPTPLTWLPEFIRVRISVSCHTITASDEVEMIAWKIRARHMRRMAKQWFVCISINRSLALLVKDPGVKVWSPAIGMS